MPLRSRETRYIIVVATGALTAIAPAERLEILAHQHDVTLKTLRLLNEPDRHRVAVEFPVARLDGGDDDQDGVQDPEDGEENEADQDQAKDRGDDVVDEHRDLEVERFLAVRIDLGRFVALGQPDDERREDVAGEMKKDAEQGAGMTESVSKIRRGVDREQDEAFAVTVVGAGARSFDRS